MGGFIMRFSRLIFIILVSAMTSAAHANEPDDWATFGRMLSLVQGFMQIAAESQGDSKHIEKHVDSLLSGKNSDANALLEDVFADMPGEQRVQVLGLARQMVSLGQRQAQIERKQTEEGMAVQARKDLSGMGLAYFDRQQFLDAVKRNDVLAVRLYLAGRGVDPRGGLDVAKNAGLPEMERVLAEAVK
jgi:hypothetical protein